MVRPLVSKFKKKWPSGKILCRACDQLTLVYAISITNIYIDKILRTRKKAAKSDNWFLIMWNVIRNWILFNKISGWKPFFNLCRKTTITAESSLFVEDQWTWLSWVTLYTNFHPHDPIHYHFIIINIIQIIQPTKLCPHEHWPPRIKLIIQHLILKV